MIDLHALKAFVAVAEEGHLTRAAERLEMRQPPLRRQIHALEAVIGAPLFDRHPRGMCLTPTGQALFEGARDVAARLERAVEAARRAARGDVGRLAVGLTATSALHAFVPGVLRAFRDAWPDIALTLHEENTTDLLAALIDDRLDASFVRSPGERRPGLTVEKLLSEEMVAAFSPAHPMASAAQLTGLPLSALADEGLVLSHRPANPGLYDAIVAACLEAGFSPRVEQEAPQMTSVLGLVAAGVGVSIVPASLGFMGSGKISFASLTGSPVPRADLFLAFRPANGSDMRARFIQFVRRSAADWSATGRSV